MKTKNNSGRGASSIAPELDRLISKQEAAGIWGVSIRTLEREINAGRIVKKKVRGCVRLRFSQVLELAGLNLNPQES